MSIRQSLDLLAQGRDIEYACMRTVMQDLMGGELTPAQTGAFLMGLHIKGETAEELRAAAEVMRKFVEPVRIAGPHLIDTCGTGGDGASLFNVSTGAALVAAAGGAEVAKHGNRAASSKSGSADVLEEMGVNIDLSPDAVAHCIRELGIGFLFAPRHHPAMKHVAAARAQLGMRTIFNLLGPLSNPAGVRRQLLGVFDECWLLPLAKVLQQLGCVHTLLLHSEDGLDEISPAAATRVAELKEGEIREYKIQPAEYGVTCDDLQALQVHSPAESAAMLRAALRGKGAGVGMLALNGGAALYVAGRVASLALGVELAEDTIHSGQAAEKLANLAQFSQMLAQKQQG